MRICVLANSSRYIWNFRINLIEALRSAGYEVIVFSPNGEEVPLIEGCGIRHVHFPLSPKSINPLSGLWSICALRCLLRKHKIDIVLTSTPKGNIYTAIANFLSARRQVANVSGLGSAYLRKDWVSRLVDFLYRLTFRRISYVFFENPTDHQDFACRGLIQLSRAEVIPGLGVDLTYFRPSLWPEIINGETRFIMIARMIGDKGVREYFEAARIVRREYPSAHFTILGDSAADNPTSIPYDELSRLISEGNVVHYEHARDVRPYIANSHCLVLPSYREGMSRTLLEAAAMARPLIASDVPGCREAIESGVNGLLCIPRSSCDLAKKIINFLNCDDSKKEEMGVASLKKIESEFDEKLVIRRYLDVIGHIDD